MKNHISITCYKIGQIPGTFHWIILLLVIVAILPACSTSSILNEEGGQPQATELAISDTGTESLQVTTGDDDLPEATDDAIAPGRIGTPLTGLFVGENAIQESMNRYYSLRTNELISLYVMAQRAIVAGDLSLALHLARRALEFGQTEEAFLLNAYIFMLADDNLNATRMMWYARQHSLEMANLYDAMLRYLQRESAIDLLQNKQTFRIIPRHTMEVEREVSTSRFPAGFYVYAQEFSQASDAQEQARETDAFLQLMFPDLQLQVRIWQPSPSDPNVLLIGPHADAALATKTKNRVATFFQSSSLLHNLP